MPTLYCISSARIDFLLKLAFLLTLTPPSTNNTTPPRLTLSSHCKGACSFLNLGIPSYRPLYNRLHCLWINCSHRPNCLVLRSYILTFALWLQPSRPRTPADQPTNPPLSHRSNPPRNIKSVKMVLLTRSLCRFARPALSSSFSTAARPAHNARVLSRGASALRHNLGSIRTLTGKREKVKVLLVLYDGKKHAEEVSCPSASLHLRNC